MYVTANFLFSIPALVSEIIGALPKIDVGRTVSWQ